MQRYHDLSQAQRIRVRLGFAAAITVLAGLTFRSSLQEFNYYRQEFQAREAERQAQIKELKISRQEAEICISPGVSDEFALSDECLRRLNRWSRALDAKTTLKDLPESDKFDITSWRSVRSNLTLRQISRLEKGEITASDFKVWVCRSAQIGSLDVSQCKTE